jgi:hypothetical protein
VASVVSALILLPGVCRSGTEFQVTPDQVFLEGNYARAQILVSAQDRSGAGERAADLTHQAIYQSSDTRIVTVAPRGQLLAAGNGETSVRVTASGVTHEVRVRVTGVVAAPHILFQEQVLPILGKAGCNAGACHASQYGKGGFKLSVFAFAPEQDYRAIVRDAVGRRVNFINPRQSLLLLKPTLSVPHEGGHRLDRDSVDYQILAAWLAAGAPAPPANPPTVTALTVTPSRRIGMPGFTQQLRVVARYRDGATRDVTAWAKFDSMDEGVLEVSRQGQVRAVGRGQGAALARFEGQAAIATIVVPFADRVELPGWVENNFIDRLAAVKFREIGLAPSPLCDDGTFLRRAYLDATGTLPTPQEAAAFLDSTDPAKRSRLIDSLLGPGPHTDAYAAYWTLKWSDLIRSNSTALGEQGMWALYNWMKGSFRENKPFDRFVRELITAQGSTFSNGPANYYRIASSPQELAEATAQLFLGVRLQCAKCHHHPYEALGQDDYYGFAAFFARVGAKGSQEFGLFGNERVILVHDQGEVANPRTGKVRPPTPLFGKPAAETADRRQALADWLTAPSNAGFARNVANRYVALLLGRGLVEPVDDLRATNPPSNAALLDALAEDFAKNGFDVKHLLRTIMSSRLYQLDSRPTPANAADDHFYSHYHVKRLPAEPLLDALDDATGVRTKFQKVPLGTRAIELPDATYNNYFLTTFGKPRREAVCECERISEPNLAQALHTLNSDILAAKIGSPQGRIGRLLAAKKPAEEIINDLYLAALCRRPTAEERTACRKLLGETSDAKAFYEDLLWSLVNSKHFLFVH